MHAWAFPEYILKCEEKLYFIQKAHKELEEIVLKTPDEHVKNAVLAQLKIIRKVTDDLTDLDPDIPF